MILCKCGCEQEIIIKKHHIYYGIPEYIKGHNKPRLGKYPSPETIEKMRGKHHTEESKQKNREKHLGKEPWNKGKPLSSETIEKIREAAIGKHPSPETIEKMREAKIGDKHPNWKGGISKSLYCERWTEKLREKIRERDDRICQNCGKNKEQNKNRKLSVHHIHYDKENCYPDLITLCCTCNSKVNFNHNYWEEYFMKILEYRDLLNYFGEKL